MNSKDPKNNLKKVTSVGIMVGSCLEFSSGVVLGIVIGYFIDKYFATSPIFTIMFLIFGFIAGIINVKRYITKNKL